MVIEFFKSFLVYSESEPLLFTGANFWIFFAIVLGVYTYVHKANWQRSAFLLLASLFFYYKSSGFYFSLLIFSTVVDYFLGAFIHNSESEFKKKLGVTLSVIVNLSVLGYFKYSYLVVDSINAAFGTDFHVVNYLSVMLNSFSEGTFSVDSIILPVGISFYTFQTISYSIDIYHKKLEPVKNIVDFGFYVSFFPQLVAGPIVRASEFIPQIYEKYSLSRKEFSMALFLILNGLIKKMIISDYISINYVDVVFDNPETFTGFANLMAVYGYAIQIYCDFSGYTDIAIGVALLMGFRLPKNFDSPYKAENITIFWRKWHISLSSWLKDYLYIPLGGNRGASFFTILLCCLIYAGFVLIPSWHPLLFIIVLMSFAFLALSFVYIDLIIMPVFSIIGFLILGAVLLPTNIVASILSFIIVLFWAFILIRPQAKTAVSTYVNLLLTMLLGGLWHGANLRFIIWGAIHGGTLALHKLWIEYSPIAKSKSKIWQIISIIITFHIVCWAWIYFRAADIDKVNLIVDKILFAFEPSLMFEVISGYSLIFGIILVGFIVHWLPYSFKDKYKEWFASVPMWGQALIAIVVAIVVFQSKSSGVQPFIYFQF